MESNQAIENRETFSTIKDRQEVEKPVIQDKNTETTTDLSADSINDLRNEFNQSIANVMEHIEELEAEREPKILKFSVSTIVAIVATALTLLTFFITNSQLNFQYKQARRAELRELLQRLATLPKENADLMKAYEDDATTLNTLSSMVNQEYTVIALQTVEIAKQIPNDITAVEYMAIAQGLLVSNATAEIENMLDQGLSVAKDTISKESLYRTYGAYLYTMGDIPRGREMFGLAVEARKNHKPSPQYAIDYSLAITEMNWAISAFGQGECNEAQSLLGQAKGRADSLPSGPGTDTLLNQIKQSSEIMSQNNQICKENKQ